MERTYTEDLITNALNTLTDGLRDFDEYDGPKLKRAISLIYGGALLAVKERIRRANPDAIYTDPSRRFTLDFKGCLKQLPLVAGVELSLDDRQVLKDAQQLRNRIEHNEFSFEIPVVLDLLSRLTGMLYSFMRDHLGVHIDQRVDAYTAHRLKDVAVIASRLDQDFFAAWMRRAAPYFDLSDDELDSLREGDGEPYHPKHNPAPEELYECRECSNESVHIEYPDIAICTDLECKEVYAIRPCEKCGAMAYNGRMFCDECLADMERYRDD